MAQQKINSIELSPRAFWYFLGYYSWNIIKRFTVVLLIATTTYAAVGLIRNGNAFGASDGEILAAFLKPLPRVLPIYFGLIFVYALIRSLTDVRCNHYNVTAQGLVIETGFLTKHITVINYNHIQKMTIVANVFDRLLKSTTVHIELVGLTAAPVALEAVDITFAKEFQKQLATKLDTKKKQNLLGPAAKKKPAKKK